MTPRIAILSGLALSLAACGQPGEQAAGAEAAASTWRMPPRVETAKRVGGELEVSGAAEPGARVVLRQTGGEAHAVTAGADGVFTLRIAAGRGDLSLQIEDQQGQNASTAPDLILALSDGAVIALSPGLGSRRLDALTGLGSVDADGRMAIISGRTAPGAESARVTVGGGAVMDVRPDARGVWTLRGDAAAAAGGVAVDGVNYAPVLSGAAPGSVLSAGDGRLIGWAAPDGAVMQTWLPSRR